MTFLNWFLFAIPIAVANLALSFFWLQGVFRLSKFACLDAIWGPQADRVERYDEEHGGPLAGCASRSNEEQGLLDQETGGANKNDNSEEPESADKEAPCKDYFILKEQAGHKVKCTLQLQMEVRVRPNHPSQSSSIKK